MQVNIDWVHGDRRWRTVNVFHRRWVGRLYRRFIVLTSRLPFRPRLVRMQIVRW